MTVTELAAKQRARGPGHAPDVALPALPPLENGDRLTRSDFERRYHARPDLKKAELIEGEVHVASPVRASHSESHGQIMTWLGAFCAATPGVKMHDNATVRLDEDNEVQPDALLRLEPATGGCSRISPDDYIEGAPELVVEIAASSASYDLHSKKNVYRRNGVREYLVWQIFDNRIDWFALSEGDYLPLSPDDANVFHSQVFPGLRLAATALLDGDVATVLAELQQGLATPEHASVVERLASSK